MRYLAEIIDSSFFENEECEFKLKLDSDLSKVEKWAKTIVGFSNANGGQLFVGVNDDGLAIGLSKEDIDITKNLVLKVINRYVFPHVDVEFHSIKCCKDKFVLSIVVPASSEMIIYKSGDFNEKVYIREDGATIPASINQILKIGKRKKELDATLLNKQYEKNAFRTYNKLATIYREDKKAPTEEILISKEVLGKDGRITQGLEMFSDDYNSDYTLVSCRLWNGYDKGIDEVIDKKEFSGSLSKTFINVLDFVRRNTRSGFIKRKDGSRLDTQSYPEQSLREAVVNAFAHRDYSISGTQIDLDIYKDRMEITSPGGWLLSKKPSEYPLDRIPSIRRNKTICNCFEAIGLMEKIGSGLRKIYNEYKWIDGKEPSLEDEGDFFTITLYDLLADGMLPFIEIGKYDKEILDFCDGTARSRDEIQKHIGYASRSHFTTEILNPLIKKGCLLMTAPAKSKNVKYITNVK